jgi:hypothetical protein
MNLVLTKALERPCCDVKRLISTSLWVEHQSIKIKVNTVLWVNLWQQWSRESKGNKEHSFAFFSPA